MSNFDPEKYKNTINPYTISEEEQLRIMNTVDDQRLTNPPGDYFRLELANKVIDIPKLEMISKQTEDGKITAVSTIEYIKNLLEEDD